MRKSCDVTCARGGEVLVQLADSEVVTGTSSAVSGGVDGVLVFVY